MGLEDTWSCPRAGPHLKPCVEVPSPKETGSEAKNRGTGTFKTPDIPGLPQSLLSQKWPSPTPTPSKVEFPAQEYPPQASSTSLTAYLQGDFNQMGIALVPVVWPPFFLPGANSDPLQPSMFPSPNGWQRSVNNPRPSCAPITGKADERALCSVLQESVAILTPSSSTWRGNSVVSLHN